MRWVVIGGEWMFSFFFPLLAFSLVYFVGLVSQSSDIPLSIKSQIKKAFHTLRREDIPIKKKNIPIQAKCKLTGSLTISENLNKSNTPIWIGKCLHTELTDPFVFLLHCQEMKYLFLLEFFVICICVTATDSHTGPRWATRKGGHNIQYLHMFLWGKWGLHF